LYVKPHLHVAKLSPNYSGHCLPFWWSWNGEEWGEVEIQIHRGYSASGKPRRRKAEKGKLGNLDSRIRSALRDRSSLQLAKLLARRETPLLRDIGANSGMEEVRTTRWTVSSRFRRLRILRKYVGDVMT